jgi:hypothetical protein
MSSNIYRIWVPIKNKIISIRDVIFDEERIFNGSLDILRDKVRKIDLKTLVVLL